MHKFLMFCLIILGVLLVFTETNTSIPKLPKVSFNKNGSGVVFFRYNEKHFIVY